jgi:hypothetical protein
MENESMLVYAGIYMLWYMLVYAARALILLRVVPGPVPVVRGPSGPRAGATASRARRSPAVTRSSPTRRAAAAAALPPSLCSPTRCPAAPRPLCAATGDRGERGPFCYPRVQGVQEGRKASGILHVGVREQSTLPGSGGGAERPASPPQGNGTGPQPWGGEGLVADPEFVASFDRDKARRCPRAPRLDAARCVAC